jgi:hypothetical protein
MPEQRELVDFMYLQTDIPPGVTIDAWRAQRLRERRGRHRPLLRARKRADLIRAYLRAIRCGGVWRAEVRDSSGAHGRMST